MSFPVACGIARKEDDGAKILKFGRNDALRWELIPTERLEKRLSFQPSLRGA